MSGKARVASGVALLWVVGVCALASSESITLAEAAIDWGLTLVGVAAISFAVALILMPLLDGDHDHER